ncbi:MAG TPA: HipA domain-containing protein [Caulobacteraceae bacterium]|jgi:serine/threonine-protein kinase HipA
MTAEVLTVWMDGFDTPAGELVRTNTGEMAFLYAEDYSAAGGLPLSMSLPIDHEEFGDVESRAYFSNLLPENNQLDAIMAREGLARDDVVGLLGHLGADCAGSVSCLPVGAPPVKTPGVLAEDYEPLEEAKLARIVRSLADAQRLPAEVDDPSPVAGVQSKIALTVLSDRRFALPRAGLRVPTTHILKVPERRNGGEARLEEAAALLAEAAGLEVSVPQALKIDGIDALLIERFDRRVDKGIVSRIHQEDFAQALGFPSELKYQRRGKLGRRFDVEAILSVLRRTSAPDSAALAFLRATLFNLCIGNTDNHAKNHALLYDAGHVPRLAPLYDLLPIRLDRRYNHELAFEVGTAKFFDDMTSEDLADLITAFGVEDIQEFVEAVVVPLIASLEKATPALRGTGLRQFDDLIGRECDRLVELLGAALDLRERDHFPNHTPGGWAAS